MRATLIPGVCLGPFALGTPIRAVINHVKGMHTQMNISYCDAEQTRSDTCLSLPEYGLHLRFDAASQRLRVIDLFDVAKPDELSLAPLAGGGDGERRVFASATGVQPTFQHIYELFGPTFAGRYDERYGAYILTYNGVSILFPIPERFRSRYDGSGTELPLELPDGTTPAASRIMLFHGKSVEAAQLPPLPPNAPYFEPVCARVGGRDGSGTRVMFANRRTSLKLGCSLQAVLGALGEPSARFDKPSGGTGGGGGGRGYFFNYFDLGIDVMFDPSCHRACKIVFRANWPGTPEFCQYSRCNLELQLPTDAASSDVVGGGAAQGGRTAPAMAAASAAADDDDCEPAHGPEEPEVDAEVESIHLTKTSKKKKKKKKKGKGKSKVHEADADSQPAECDTAAEALDARESATEAGDTVERNCAGGTSMITFATPWKQVEQLCGPAGRPVVHSASSATHPFGATLFYRPCPGCIIEVMQSGCIASATLLIE